MLIKLRDGIKGLIFFITPMLDDTFLQTLVMWESHERNSSSSTPRHLLQLTGRMDRRTDGRADRRMGGWTYVRMDRIE